MKSSLENIPVSVLDLATIVEGSDAAGAFHRSLELAREAEQLGYKRFWFAEHHNMESVASSATAVLIGYVAAHTRRIRVGSGGIMLPNHAPLIIAEQFGTLASLYPGRIDLGIGRAPGTDALTAQALRRHLRNMDEEFPNDVMELIQYLEPAGEDTRVRAVPGEGTRVPVWLLGSSTYSARLAALLGLPFAFAAHFAPAYLKDALNLYRQQFRPSAYLQQPLSMACVNVIAAPSDAEAAQLATSFYQLALGLVRNRRRPLQPPVNDMDDIWTEAEKAAVLHMMQYTFSGSAETVKQRLRAFVDETGVDELMVTSHIYDNEARLRSFRLIAPFFRREPA